MWAGMRGIGLVEAERTNGKNETSIHRRYYLVTLDDVNKFARAV